MVRRNGSLLIRKEIIMLTNTYQTYLMESTDGKTAYSKLVDIINYPDLGGAPEMIDVTTLSDPQIRNILGIQSADSMEFDILYEPESFKKLKDKEGQTLHLAIYLGATGSTPDGSLGKFTFDGMMSVYLAGGNVNEARKAKLTIAASTEISFAQGS